MAPRMPFDWYGYLEIARHLSRGVTNLSTEATGRSAVSRAYYAAYGHTRRYAKGYGFRPSGGAADHARLVAYLKANGHPSEADDLEDMRILRNQCDYDDTVGALALIVPTSISGAARLIQTLR